MEAPFIDDVTREADGELIPTTRVTLTNRVDTVLFMAVSELQTPVVARLTNTSFDSEEQVNFRLELFNPDGEPAAPCEDIQLEDRRKLKPLQRIGGVFDEILAEDSIAKGILSERIIPTGSLFASTKEDSKRRIGFGSHAIGIEEAKEGVFAILRSASKVFLTRKADENGIDSYGIHIMNSNSDNSNSPGIAEDQSYVIESRSGGRLLVKSVVAGAIGSVVLLGGVVAAHKFKKSRFTKQ